jgi:DNA-directed RNA polymerase specialized sigma subunit
MMHGRAWTNRENDFITKNWQSMTLDEMSQKLNRSSVAIYDEQLLLGLRRGERMSWSVEDNEKLKQLYCTTSLSHREIGEKLGRSEKAVSQHLERIRKRKF